MTSAVVIKNIYCSTLPAFSRHKLHDTLQYDWTTTMIQHGFVNDTSQETRRQQNGKQGQLNAFTPNWNPYTIIEFLSFRHVSFVFRDFHTNDTK